MMKHNILVMFLAIIISVGIQYGRSEAADIYLGVNNNGTNAYLVEETIQYKPLYDRNGYFDGYKYNCQVKSVYQKNDFYYDIYDVILWSQGMTTLYKNGTEYTRQRFFELPEESVEKKLAWYLWKYDRDLHGDISNY